MDSEVAQLKKAITEGGCEAADRLVPQLLRALAAPDQRDQEVREVLNTLRSHRCFAPMDELATELADRASGRLNIFIRRQLAQANVERGRLDAAIDILNKLSAEVQAGGAPKDRSEVNGLLGRARKQQFVNAAIAGETGAAELKAAIKSYQEVFDLDPAWHGANLIALSARAERAGIPIDSGTAKSWAERLLRELAEKERTAWNPWDYAAAGEAHLALGNEEHVADSFSTYWHAPNVDGFALAGTARQLREIWQVNAASKPFLSSLLLQLDAQQLGKHGAQLQLSAGDLQSRAKQIEREQASGRAEATFGAGSGILLECMLRATKLAKSVCKIVDINNRRRSGTGFLVDGSLLSPAVDGVVLLTNHHVLHGDEACDQLLAHPDYQGSIDVRHAEAEFMYWQEVPKTHTFKLARLVRYSERDEADCAMALIHGAVPRDLALALSTEVKPLRSRNILDPKQRSKVLVIGHPKGDAITFSLTDNEVVDHELDDAPCNRPRRIHYRAPTEPGSSGSPVFEFETLQVVGLHRSGRAQPLRDDWPHKKQDDVYEANEAVWIRSVLDRAVSP